MSYAPPQPGQPYYGEPVPAPARKPSKWPWIALVAALVFAGSGVYFLYDRNMILKDSGFAACEAMAKGEKVAGNSGGKLSEADYKKARGVFADSRYDDIRDHGTKLIDVVWQMQQATTGKPEDGFAALAYLQPLSTHMAGLTSACADLGFTVKLTPDAKADAPAKPAAGAAVKDAKAVIGGLKAANLGLTNVAVQNEDTDPNNKLGRPGGYTSRASADLPGGDGERFTTDRGVVVEVFATADLAQQRSDYIKGLQSGSPMLGSEWHYRTADGTGLVRVSGKVKPSLAKKVEKAVAGL